MLYFLIRRFSCFSIVKYLLLELLHAHSTIYQQPFTIKKSVKFRNEPGALVFFLWMIWLSLIKLWCRLQIATWNNYTRSLWTKRWRIFLEIKIYFNAKKILFKWCSKNISLQSIKKFNTIFTHENKRFKCFTLHLICTLDKLSYPTLYRHWIENRIITSLFTAFLSI